jgi:tetratricopeptide (TPR) repeat protein
VEKSKLNQLLSHFSGSTPQEAEELITLSKRFPYSQVLQALAARTAQDHSWSNRQALLQLAAVYSTDRGVLKEIMSATYTPYVTTTTESNESPVTQQNLAQAAAGTIDYAFEVMQDLKRLKELKENFEMKFMVDAEPAPMIQETTPTESEQEKPVKKKASPKSTKRQRLIELASELQAPEETEPKKPARKKQDTEPLISEIKATKKKVQPENEKTREQIEIITQFIKSKPNLSPPKATPPIEAADLASTLKSGEFGDNIISETLAEILIRQGKKDKAIEVYKKLIWKFPQKKAYFAAQIEDLKK